ncbi:hypothetical protein BaRGS_00020002 [Batillaria attramentaria]|uniref:tRNA wybutosine-synthesizing protein 4 n=1 Tax=Batillaria attramentaria TaxID=370345 RepID=A0ABD0KNU2_9CAEN
MEQNSSERKPKTSKSRRETAVQGTNDNSIVSKCSMSAAGYFPDHFLQHFVAKHSKRAPLINRGYYLRAVSIDQVLRNFLAQSPGCKKQIISLGAGFDSSYFRLKADRLLQDASFYEVDFPEVVKKKHAIIQGHEELFSLLQFSGQDDKILPPIEISSLDYFLLGVDLTQLNTLEAALRLCGADFDTQTLLLSECVMTYMTRRCSSALVKWAGETFQDAFFVMFEQINPDDAFGLFMRNHFHTVGSPLKCIASFPTLDSQNKRFLGLGWQVCKSYDLNEIYRHILSPEERARIETLDPFDEYEEFNLKLQEVGAYRSISFYFYHISESRFPQPEQVPDMISITPLAAHQTSVKRFSHSSVLVGDRFVVTAGGFGEVDGRHQRVQEVSVTDTVTMETKLIRCHSDDIQYSRMHHASVVLSDGQIMLCGGRQSPFFLCSQLLLLNLEVDTNSNQNLDAPNQNSCSCVNHSASNCASGREKEEYTEFEGGRLQCSVLRQSGDVPCPRWRHACTLVKIEGRDFVVLHGGRTQHAEVLADTYLLDVQNGFWTKLECMGDLPGPRHSHTLVTWEDGDRQLVVMMGGMDDDQNPHCSVYLLDVASAHWQALALTPFLPRYSHTCHIVGDQLVVVGGVNLHQQTPGVGIINLRTGTAQEFAFPNLGQQRLLMFHRHCSIILPDNRVVVLGGGGNCFSFGTHLNHTPVILDISNCLTA